MAFEATYGWGWFADLLADVGIDAHMAHPLATKAIASARVYTLLHEAGLFPPSASALRAGTDVLSYVSAFVAPLVRSDGRAPFIGIGIGAAAVASLRWFPRTADSHLRGCAAAFVASAVFSVIPSVPMATITVWVKIILKFAPVRK